MSITGLAPDSDNRQNHRFSEEQIVYMKSLGLNFNFDRLTSDEWVAIEETVGDRLCQSGFDKDYNINSDGVMCESILDKLPTG